MTAVPDSRQNDAWRDFVAGKPPGEGVREIVRESWARSRAFGVDPLAARPVRVVRDAGERLAASDPLREIARPHLAWIERALGDVSHAVFLVDRDGVVLAAGGNDDAIVARFGLFPGSDWSERALGTTGAGTALAAGEPVVVWGPEHFVRDLHDTV